MLRWRIAILVSVAIAISYLDRQTLPVAVTAIARDIPLTNQRFSALQSAFLLSYALMYMGGGKLVDALGTRIGFAVIMAFWSLANASHALATSFAMLMASRFLLGLGEGGGFPAATRAVAEWFPMKERATAMGIINAGTSVGAVIAPPLIALVLSLCRLALDFCGHRRLSDCCGRGGGSHLIFRRRILPNACAAMRLRFRGFHAPTCAGLICCEFASPGDW